MIIELENRRADRDAALLLQFHPVRGGGPLIFARSHGARQMDGVAVKEKLFRQSGFAGVRMRDDRKGAAAGDFFGWRH